MAAGRLQANVDFRRGACLLLASVAPERSVLVYHEEHVVHTADIATKLPKTEPSHRKVSELITTEALQARAEDHTGARYSRAGRVSNESNKQELTHHEKLCKPS